MAVEHNEFVADVCSQDRDSARNSRPNAALRGTKAARARSFVLTRATWVLTGILLGAAAGWTAFRAFLTLITLD